MNETLVIIVSMPVLFMILFLVIRRAFGFLDRQNGLADEKEPYILPEKRRIGRSRFIMKTTKGSRT